MSKIPSKIPKLTLRSRVGPRGQVVIPRPLRDALGIGPNSEVLFSIQDDKVVLEKKDPVDTLEEFLAAIPDKVQTPERIDWDAEYYEQFG